MPKKYFAFAAWFLPLTPFTKEIGLVRFGTVDMDVISYPFFLLSFFLFVLNRKISISKSEAIIFSIIFSIGIVNLLLFDLPIKPFFKQFFPIVLIYFVIKTIFMRMNPVTIFEKYVYLATIAAWLGILQFSLKLVGIKFLTTHTQLFIDSVALEPSHYVVMVMPAFIYLYEKKIYNKNFFLLGITLILTFKLTALLSFVTYYVLSNIKKSKQLIVIFPFILFGSIYIINNNTAFENRIDNAINFTQTNDMSKIENLTTFSFISNTEVAKQNFKDTYGFGIGLGGHETTYLRNFSNVDIYNEEWRGTNMRSAHSLLIRVTSELGLIGLFILFMLFYKSYNIKYFEYRVIAWASLSHFVVKFYKTGSYLDYGTIFFLVTIITMIQLDRKRRKNW